MFCPLSPLQVFGGGAAGVFAAITAKQAHPNRDVILYEKSSRLLSKVKISGGGEYDDKEKVAEILARIDRKIFGSNGKAGRDPAA